MALIKRELLRQNDDPYVLAAGRPVSPVINSWSAPATGDNNRDRPDAMEIQERMMRTNEETLSRATEEARKIINDARNESRNVLEAARQEGLDSGKQEGWSQVGEYIKQALETLNQAILDKNNIIKSSEPEILKLAIKISEQIIRSEVSLNRDVCLSIVSEAISKITDREQVIIRVNQNNLEQVRSQRERLASLMDGVKNLTIQEDPTVEPGGCIVETNLGYVDARISTKLTAIEEALNRVLSDDKKLPGVEVLQPASEPAITDDTAKVPEGNPETDEEQNEEVPEFPAE